jgi:hypothetical protein
LIKALIRAAFEAWVAALTVTMLVLNGNGPSVVTIPFDKGELSAKVQSDPS